MVVVVCGWRQSRFNHFQSRLKRFRISCDKRHSWRLTKVKSILIVLSLLDWWTLIILCYAKMASAWFMLCLAEECQFSISTIFCCNISKQQKQSKYMHVSWKLWIFAELVKLHILRIKGTKIVIICVCLFQSWKTYFFFKEARQACQVGFVERWVCSHSVNKLFSIGQYFFLPYRS